MNSRPNKESPNRPTHHSIPNQTPTLTQKPTPTTNHPAQPHTFISFTLLHIYSFSVIPSPSQFPTSSLRLS
ncbi:hypothetical protein BofuT4_uP112750.1 [Botrytis cinerea T4]|uniref:Uncharacterized protein n=1 Tax=Botryotinia fuckeliana (strain T4) TaxID=999810 RepID=G2Y5M5_BOTF4|nr:hypothetical protein BofuT4_uP112750.1 [Botrytis cinerea T4]